MEFISQKKGLNADSNKITNTLKAPIPSFIFPPAKNFFIKFMKIFVMST